MKVEISHPEKVLFPDVGVTKGELAAYYERVAEWMLPHVRNRPLSMQRAPAGIQGHVFFHKDAPEHFPAWVGRVEAEKRGGTVTHALARNADTLVYLANQNCITPHVWLSRADRLHQPDRLVIDLDPSRADFAAVRRAARAAGELVREVGLEPFAQVTGSRGIHVWVPLRRGADFEEVKAFSRDLARVLASRAPAELTTETRKVKRDDRIYLDVNRNAYAQTVVPPYAVRIRPGAPVAVPIAWEELGDSKLQPDRWNVRSVPRRLARTGDPWAEIGSHARGISEARRRLAKLVPE